LHDDAPEGCLRKSGEKYNNKCISTTVKHGGRVSLLAATGELHRCEKLFNAFRVWRILQNGLLPKVKKLLSKED